MAERGKGFRIETPDLVRQRSAFLFVTAMKEGGPDEQSERLSCQVTALFHRLGK